MGQLNDAQANRLAGTAHRAQVIRSFCQHEGFKIYKDELEAIIADKKNSWLQGTEDEARDARQKAQGVQLAMNVLKKLILEGDQAQHILEVTK